VKAVSDAMGVSRSNLYERDKKPKAVRRGYYHKSQDEELLPHILELVHQRPTYGYRRIHSLLNRRRKAQGRRLVNHKRIYRIMKQNNLLLSRCTAKRSECRHDGVVITLRPNMRWCSDEFELACWNGEKVHVAFSLDCCDREVMSHVATTAGINSEMIRDLMLQTVEYRFGQDDKVPQPIEWLSDNGSCYTARDTRAFAKSLGLVCCTTPVSSPQSNGMAEAFVKTFKRDYVYVHDCPNAMTVMALLHEWFEDYNEIHPHQGLKMKSPREFIRSYST
jgi:transposase InsO family protein